MIYPQTVSYALEALCHLARLSPNTNVKVREIAAELDIPEHFLGKVLTQLVRKKLIVSSKGPTGGVALARDPAKCTVQDVFAALDAQDLLEERCVLGMRECSDDNACPFHKEWGRFKRGVQSVAQKTTLAQLSKKM